MIILGPNLSKFKNGKIGDRIYFKPVLRDSNSILRKLNSILRKLNSILRELNSILLKLYTCTVPARQLAGTVHVFRMELNSLRIEFDSLKLM